jgi:hypothetical protein
MKTLVFIISLILLSNIVSATPQLFTGKVIYLDESNDLSEYTITAGINGVISSYSYIDKGHYSLVIDSSKDNILVDFYINGQKINKSVLFSSFEATQLDLVIDKLPKNKIFCGDNVCSNSECSFCSVDCNYIVCSRNKICDINIGENCSNSRGDCGVCDALNNTFIEEPVSTVKKDKFLLTGAFVAVLDDTINYGWIILSIIFLLIIYFELIYKRREGE